MAEEQKDHILPEGHVRAFLDDIKSHLDGTKPLAPEQLSTMPSGYRESLQKDMEGHGGVISRALDVIKDHEAGHPSYDRLHEAMKGWNPEGDMSARDFVSSTLKGALPEMGGPAKDDPAKAANEKPTKDEPTKDEPAKDGPAKESPRQEADQEQMQARQAGQTRQQFAQPHTGPVSNSTNNGDLLGVGRGVAGLGGVAEGVGRGIASTIDAGTTAVGRGFDKIVDTIRNRSRRSAEKMEQAERVVRNQEAPSKPAPDSFNRADEASRNRAGREFAQHVSDAHEAARNKDQAKFDEAYAKMGKSLSDEMTKDSELVHGRGADRLTEADGKEISDRYKQRGADIEAVNKSAEENGLTPNKEMKEGMAHAMERWTESIKKLIEAIIERIRGLGKNAENTKTHENSPSM